MLLKQYDLSLYVCKFTFVKIEIDIAIHRTVQTQNFQPLN